MKPATLSTLFCALTLAISSAFAEDAALELRLIVPEGTVGAVQKTLKASDPLKGRNEEFYCGKEVLLDSSMVKTASASQDARQGWSITVELTDQGAQRLKEATTAHVRERIGILANGQLLSAPMVNEPIAGGAFMISGAFSEEQARELAKSFMSKPASTNKEKEKSTTSNGPMLAPNAPTDKPVRASASEASKLDDAMAPYVKKALASYPDAKKRFLAGLPPGQGFFITTRLHNTDGKFEQVFIAVQRIADEHVMGTIASKVQYVVGYQQGDVFTFPETEILDWLISKPDGTEEGNVVGNFLDTYKP